LQQTEAKLKDMTATFHRLKSETEEGTEKSRRSAEQSTQMTHNLQDEIDKLKKTLKQIQQEKQRIEQENDNLERRERESSASLLDLTEKVNKILEENVWLQTELEEQRTRSQEASQRSKEEIRDLKLEMTLSHLTTKEPQPPKKKLDASPQKSVILVDDLLTLVRDMEKKLQNGVFVPGPGTTSSTTTTTTTITTTTSRSTPTKGTLLTATTTAATSTPAAATTTMIDSKTSNPIETPS